MTKINLPGLRGATPTTNIEGNFIVYTTRDRRPRQCQIYATRPRHAQQTASTTFHGQHPDVPPLGFEPRCRTTQCTWKIARKLSRQRSGAVTPDINSIRLGHVCKQILHYMKLLPTTMDHEVVASTHNRHQWSLPRLPPSPTQKQPQKTAKDDYLRRHPQKGDDVGVVLACSG
jgi:hypothetical protein